MPEPTQVPTLLELAERVSALESRLTSELLSVPDAAKAMGIAQITVHRLVASGALPTTRIGRRLLFRRADIDAFIASNTSRRSAAERIVA